MGEFILVLCDIYVDVVHIEQNIKITATLQQPLPVCQLRYSSAGLFSNVSNWSVKENIVL